MKRGTEPLECVLNIEAESHWISMIMIILIIMIIMIMITIMLFICNCQRRPEGLLQPLSQQTPHRKGEQAYA